MLESRSLITTFMPTDTVARTAGTDLNRQQNRAVRKAGRRGKTNHLTCIRHRTMFLRHSFPFRLPGRHACRPAPRGNGRQAAHERMRISPWE